MADFQKALQQRDIGTKVNNPLFIGSLNIALCFHPLCQTQPAPLATAVPHAIPPVFKPRKVGNINIETVVVEYHKPLEMPRNLLIVLVSGCMAYSYTIHYGIPLHIHYGRE